MPHGLPFEKAQQFRNDIQALIRMPTSSMGDSLYVKSI